MYFSPWMQALLLPRKWDVCGIIVPPLSVWHVYILQTSGNGYLCGDKMTLDSAAEVLMYATLDIKGGRRLYTQPFFRRRHRKRIIKKLQKTRWDDIHVAMTEYVSDCMRTPGHERKAPKAGEPPQKMVAAPTAWVLAQYLSGGDITKLDDAFDAPFSAACCMFDAKRNVTGEDDTLIDEVAEKRTDEKLAIMREKKEKADNKKKEVA